MKKIFSFLTAILFAGSMMAEGVLFEQTYPGTPSTKTNAYYKTFTLATGDYTLKYVNINNGSSNDSWTEIRAGSKNEASVAKVFTMETIPEKVSKVTINFTQVGVSNTNDLRLEIASDTMFTEPTKISKTIAKGEIAFEIEEPAEDLCYRIVIDQKKGSANGFNRFDRIRFYSPDGVTAPTIMPEDPNFLTSVEVSLSADEGAEIFYTLDESAPSASSTKYTAPFELTATTLVKAIAISGSKQSLVAEKLFFKTDTISVTEARAHITAAKPNTHAYAHFVRGVVKGNVFDPNQTMNGKLAIWMTDEVNSKDSLEAYQIYGGPNEKAWTQPEAQKLIGEGDTILVYAPKLMFYAAKNYYETDGGYFVEVLGKYQEDPTIVYDTLTVEEAKAAAGALPDNGSSEKKVYVEGFAKHVAKYDALKGNQTFFMADVFTEDIDSTFEAYLATPKKNGEAYPVLEGDKVRAFGYLKKYIDTKNNNKVILEITDPLVSFISEVEGDRTIVIPKTDTISVEKALEIGAALADNAVTEDTYVIEGYVSDIENYFDSSKKETFWMASTKGSRACTNATGAFYVYGGVPTPAAEMGLEAHIFVTTKIKKYKSSKGEVKIENDGTAVNVVEPGLPEVIESITVARALEIGGALTAGNKTDNRYEITGWVSAIEEHYSAKYGNETFWIHDTEGSRAASNSEGAFEIYQCKPNTGEEIGIDAKIKIVCKIKKHTNGVIENNGNNIEFEVLEQGHDEQIDTLTVEEAVALGKTLAPSMATTGQEKSAWVVVKGFAVSVKPVSTEYNNQDWYMSDDPDEEKGEFKAHQCSFDKEVVVGDYMYVLGRIVNYGTAESSTIEISRGTGTHGVAPVIEIEEVTVAQALEIGRPLDIDEKTSKTYAVTGYIAIIREDFDEDTQTMSALLSDSETATAGTFFAEVMKLDKAAEEHEKVRVVGKIMKQESASGNEIVGIWNGKATRIFPESIEEVVLTEKAQKVMIDGVMYIVRDNKLFDVRGTRVR